jgi:hypothetical protein
MASDRKNVVSLTVHKNTLEKRKRRDVYKRLKVTSVLRNVLTRCVATLSTVLLWSLSTVFLLTLPILVVGLFCAHMWTTLCETLRT